MRAPDTTIRKASLKRERGRGVHEAIQLHTIEARATYATDLAKGDVVNDLQLVTLCEAELGRAQKLIRVAKRASVDLSLSHRRSSSDSASDSSSSSESASSL